MSEDKVLEIYKELLGEKACRLSPERFLADSISRTTEALRKENPEWTEEELIEKDAIGQHLLDWQRSASFLVALALFPDRFTDEEIQDEIKDFMAHAPEHVREAERLYFGK